MATTLLCAVRPFLRTMARTQHATCEKALKVYPVFEASAFTAAWYTVGTSGALMTVLRGNMAAFSGAKKVIK